MYCDHRIRESKMLENIVNSPVKHAISSGQQGNKRKSINQFIDENNENINDENVVHKHDEVTNNSSAVKKANVNNNFAIPTKKPTSALPRYQSRSLNNSAYSQASTPSYVSSNSTIYSLANPSNISASSTPYSTSSTSLSPRKNGFTSVLSSTNLHSNNGLMKRLKEVTVPTSSQSVVKGLFEKLSSNGSANAKDIATLLTVKAKKCDYKDKINKQDEAIKECKLVIFNHFNELNELKIDCLKHDARVNSVLNECIDAIAEKDEAYETLSQTHSNISLKLSEKDSLFQEIEKKYSTLKDEYEPQAQENKAMKQKLKESNDKVIQLETNLSKTEHENVELKQDCEAMKGSHTDAMQQLKQQHSLELIACTEKYQSIQIKYDQAQIELTQLRSEKSSMEHDKNVLEKQQIEFESKLREFVHSSNKNVEDLEKLTKENLALNEKLNEKDADVRNMLNSISGIQQSANEEKMELKTELNLLKSRVELLNEENRNISNQLEVKIKEYSICDRDLLQSKGQYNALDIKYKALESELIHLRSFQTSLEIEKELRAQSEHREKAAREECIAATAHSMARESECNSRIRSIEEKTSITISSLENDILTLQKERDLQVKELHDSVDMITSLDMEVKSLRQGIDDTVANQDKEAVKELSKVTGELEVMKRRIKELTDIQDTHVTVESKKIAEYEERLKQSEIQRRKLHNLVQELRGNIRVFARVRPFLPTDGIDTSVNQNGTIATITETNSLRICKQLPSNTGASSNSNEEYSFQFDKVFGPSSTQESIFQEVSEFVQSALDGYHVCLFSYGQTGSGKTHTMQGCGTGHMKGIIPRAMQQVGIYKTELETKGWVYTMEVTFIEIYNETIRDLLRTSSAVDNELKHDIKKDINNYTYVSDVTTITVDPNNVEQINEIMEIASRHRSVGQTQMNEVSSRSHSVFALHLIATNAAQGLTLKGTLSLVDLAGSERLDRSGATGAQMKETVAINKSLSSLTDVFVAIGNKQTHIPYRNSKLTYLLQPALSGDGKTLMMVNLSPTDESFHESLCSLRLAKQVNQCELGKPKKQLKDIQSSINGSSVTNSSTTATATTAITSDTSVPKSTAGSTQSSAVPLSPRRVVTTTKRTIAPATTSKLGKTTTSLTATSAVSVPLSEKRKPTSSISQLPESSKKLTTRK